MARNQFHIQPRSKKDRSLPFTYEGWVDILAGQGTEPVYDHYFSDTLCGLVEVLDENGFRPEYVILKGLYRGKRINLDSGLCTDCQGHWLKRPQLCRALEKHYDHSHEECYKGHVEKGHCLFEDRDRKGVGPVW